MTQLRKVLVMLPDSLLSEADNLVAEKQTTRSNLIKEAIKHYVAETKKKNLDKQMADGYVYMGNINAELAELGMHSALRELEEYEEGLSVGE